MAELNDDALSDNYVPGDGPIPCDVMIIGEAPGEDEDKELRPFVGRAGRYLDKKLAEVGLPRENVYVTNIVKRRPPNNRRPHPSECIRGLPDLLAEIAAVKPKYVLLLGNTALSTLTVYQGGITKHHGRLEPRTAAFGANAAVFATLHPSAILHNPNNGKMFQEDLAEFASLVQKGTL